MEKQLNFLNIFDEEGKKKADKTDEVDERKGIKDNEDIDKKDVLENDPIAFDQFEAQQKEEANRLIQESERAAYQKQLEVFLIEINEKRGEISLSDFDPFLSDLKHYHERFESFRKDLQEAKPGLEKERIYRKIVSPSTEDEPEFRAIAALYLIYLEKIKELTRSAKQKEVPVKKKRAYKPKKRKEKGFWNTPKFDQGKDAAAGAYLDYKE
jgi:hypothetical protein